MADGMHDNIRENVLARMDRHARVTRLAILGAALFESLLMAVALLRVDWKNETQVLLFLFFVLSYTIVALGLIALGAHVSRVGARIVAALEERSPA
jgi:hypothetical protein